MEEKKLTDEEKLIKQIRYLADRYGTANCIGNPSKNFFIDTLDLIQRLQKNNANQVRMRCDMQRKFDDLQTLCTEQRAENEQLKKDYIELDLECRGLRTELDKELAEHEEFTQKAKAEIERLTEDKNNLYALNMNLIQDKAELQKQVDKCFMEVGKMCAEAEKDTAKQILAKAPNETNADEMFIHWLRERYGVEVE